MIIWISSYPKSGSTWLRSLITSYFYSDDGIFNFEMLDKIQQFSSKDFSNEIKNDSNYQNIISSLNSLWVVRTLWLMLCPD